MDYNKRIQINRPEDLKWLLASRVSFSHLVSFNRIWYLLQKGLLLRFNTPSRSCWWTSILTYIKAEVTGALQLQPPQIPFPPSIIQPGKEKGFTNTEQKQFNSESRGGLGSWVGEGEKGTGKREHYLLEVFKFIARMMFLISTATIN